MKQSDSFSTRVYPGVHGLHLFAIVVDEEVMVHMQAGFGRTATVGKGDYVR